MDPRVDPRWRKLVAGPNGSLFTSPEWIDAVCGTYGFTPQARIAVGDRGEPLGGFAWVPVSDLRGDRLCSLPFCDRADPVVGDDRMWNALVDGVLTSDVRLSLRCLRSSAPLHEPRLVATGEAAWHGTPLCPDVEELRRRISGRARRNISLAERNGVKVEMCTGLDAVRDFHRLHVSLRKRKYRLLAQPLEFFERIWAAFAPRDAVLTLLAWADGEPVAGAMFLIWNDVLYYKFGASLPEYLRFRPNHAIWWTAMRWGAERGLRLVDWGLSDLDQPGLVGFKQQWGSEEQRIVTLRSPGRSSPTQAEADRLLNEVTQLLVDDSVPDEITTRAGELLYRYFC
ncbi:MAG TPA: GNAT family N-acetyltransferase [Pseudonocardiaceae bacterium]